jgi:hypothetical protein
VIKVSVFYPNGEGKHFDMAYYCEKHRTWCQRNGDRFAFAVYRDGAFVF